MPELALTGDAVPAKTARGGFLALWRAVPRAYAVLEARRNRVLYAGWPLVILGSLPLAAFIARSVEYPAGQGVAAALLAWTLAGLPLTAVLFGAVAGAGLRGKAEEDAAALPVAPRARALAALGTAAAALAGNAALVAALIALATPDTRQFLAGASELGAAAWRSGHGAVLLSMLVSAGLAPLLLGWLLAVSFGVALLSAHAVLGGVAALIGGALAMFPVAGGLLVQLHSDGRAGFLLPAAACAGALAWGALAAVSRAAPLAARARWPGWLRAGFLALLPLAGSLAAWPALYRARDRVLALQESVWVPWDHTRGSSVRHGSADLRRGIGGRLTSGRGVLLEGDRPTLAQLMRGERMAEVHHAYRDPQGYVWAEVWHPAPPGAASFSEIWVGKDGAPLRRYAALPGDTRFATVDGRPAVDTAPLSLRDDKYILLDPAKPPVLKRPDIQ